MSHSQGKLPELSPAQAEIMRIVWERGEVSASQVVRELTPRRKVSRNTVRTLIERMEEKGWLTHREEGRTFLYSAARPHAATIGQKVREIVDSVCGGSAETLVAALLDYRGLDRDELIRIRQLLDRARADKHQKGEA
jgi:predicted transcriptional regulator